MYWNTSENWHRHEHRHGRNWWIAPLVIFGLIILTHGWILILPLMVLAGFAFFGFVLPRLMWHMHNGDWGRGGWQNSDWAQGWQEKRKRQFNDWHNWNNGVHSRYDEKPKRDDDIEYV